MNDPGQTSDLSPELLDRLVEDGDLDALYDALVSLAFERADEPWVRDRLSSLAQHVDPRVRRVAAMCKGYTAGSSR